MEEDDKIFLGAQSTVYEIVNENTIIIGPSTFGGTTFEYEKSGNKLTLKYNQSGIVHLSKGE